MSFEEQNSSMKSQVKTEYVVPAVHLSYLNW